MKKIEIRHTTPYESYRRGGLVLRKRWQLMEVSEEVAQILSEDDWIEIREPQEAKTAEQSKAAEKAKAAKEAEAKAKAKAAKEAK